MLSQEYPKYDSALKHFGSTNNDKSSPTELPPSTIFSKEVTAVEAALQLETSFRIRFAAYYFDKMNEAMDSNNLNSTLLTESVLLRLVDAMILGTSVERIEAHFKTYVQCYGENITMNRFQMCLYSLYEPEVDTIKDSLLLIDKIDKKSKKKTIPNEAKYYLLDGIELNRQARCIMAWSDPDYQEGFKPVDDDYEMNWSEILKSRQEFFKEGEKVGGMFMEKIIGKRREFYNDKHDNREKTILGSVFFFGTCFLDWII